MNLKPIFEWLDGRKSHLVALLIGIAAALLWLFGEASSKELVFAELAAFGLSALRHAIAKMPAEQQLLLMTAIDLYRSAAAKINELPKGPPVTINPPPGSVVEQTTVDGVSSLRIFPEPPSTSDAARPAEASNPRL